LVRQESHFLPAASGAGNAIGPAPRYEVVPAIVRIGEVYYGVLKAGRFSFHASILARLSTLVKYIFTLKSFRVDEIPDEIRVVSAAIEEAQPFPIVQSVP
jgi:hypothetical protein